MRNALRSLALASLLLAFVFFCAAVFAVAAMEWRHAMGFFGLGVVNGVAHLLCLWAAERR